MFVSCRIIGCLIALVLSALPAGSVSNAAESKEAREQRLIEGAKKEGEVVIWHISNLNKKEVLAPFMKKYPFINVKTWRHRGAEGATKAIEEAKANLHNHDLSILADQNMGRILQAGLLAEYNWPNTKGWVHQPDHNFYRGIVASAKVPTFNTKTIAKSDWPKTWEDLIDAKWQGRALASTSGEDTALYTAYFWRKGDRELNWDKSFKYWSDVITATKPKVSRGFTGPTEMLAAGTSSLLIWNAANTAQRAIWKGAPLQMLPVGHLIAGNHSLAILKEAPHPNAARLFADYITSREGLVPYADTRAVLVNSLELAKVTKANKDLEERGFTFSVLPHWAVTKETNAKSVNFWLQQLGVKKKGRKR